MVAVPRRPPDRGVDHRPRDHRDAGRTGSQRVGGFRAARWAVRSCSSVEHRAYPIKIPPEGMVMCGAYG